MAKRDVFGVGGLSVAAASATLRQRMTLSSNAATASLELQVEGLPRLVFWIFQVGAGPLPVSFQPQFGVSGATAVPNATVEWLDLQQIEPTPIATPRVLNFTMPARWIRLLLTRPAGQATTVDLVLAGTQ